MWPFKRKSPEQKVAHSQRKFAAAELSSLLHNWAKVKEEIDTDLKRGGQRLRARAREAAKNNDYARRYLQLLKTNVIGPTGSRLQVRSKNRKGTLDVDANNKVETAFKQWCSSVDVTGRLTMVDLQNMMIEGSARDGELLIREVAGFPNAFGYALQVFDVDQLDEQYNVELKNGNTVRLGVEFDQWDRPVAYHLTQREKISGSYMGQGKERIRIPASEMIHVFRGEYANQSRGFSWMVAALVEMHHLAHFNEASLIRARLGASIMGLFYEENFNEGGAADWKNGSGDLFMDAEPGAFRRMPAGVRLETFSPDFPSEIVEHYVKRSLKSIASGLNVDYNSLASDPAETSYSTLRQFALESRDYYRTLQNWLAESALNRIYAGWLKQALLRRTIDLPASAYEKLLDARWQPRGWSWVDPVKDATSAEKLLANNLTSPSMIAAEQGRDFDEVCQQIAADRELMKKHKIYPEDSDVQA